MSVQVAASSAITVPETITTNAPFANATASQIKHDKLNENFALGAATSPAASDHAAFQQALTAGAATIDLTAMSGTDNRAVNGTGKKVRICKFRNPATNANPITLTFGATNGYLLLGTGWKMILAPGQSTGPIYLCDGAPAIDATHKNIDLAGAGTQALDCEIVIG